MIVEIEGGTATKLYLEGLQKFRVFGRKEHSRNGPVIAMPGPTLMTLLDPRKRVLDDPIRNANPFFHAMEFVWMMAGRLDVKWIAQFNKQMEAYADDGIISAAYGYRWRYHYGKDQIQTVIDMLRSDPGTRQAVLQMWDPDMDLGEQKKDKACNTEILFRTLNGALDMTVINRSNDFVWGAVGANICHMTMLHETVAHYSGIPLGKYMVFSNNMHIYENMPRYAEISQQIVANEVYNRQNIEWMHGETDSYQGFVQDCEYFCSDHQGRVTHPWLLRTARPIYDAWMEHKAGDAYAAGETIALCTSDDWRTACTNWLQRKYETS